MNWMIHTRRAFIRNRLSNIVARQKYIYKIKLIGAAHTQREKSLMIEAQSVIRRENCFDSLCATAFWVWFYLLAAHEKTNATHRIYKTLCAEQLPFWPFPLCDVSHSAAERKSVVYNSPSLYTHHISTKITADLGPFIDFCGSFNKSSLALFAFSSHFNLS